MTSALTALSLYCVFWFPAGASAVGEKSEAFGVDDA